MDPRRRWTIKPPQPAAEELAARLKTSPLIAQILLNRGLHDPDLCLRFLRPSLKMLVEPNLLPNLPRAAERIARAIRDNQQIVIYGDYDVDGITATSLLWHAIRILGGKARWYIPHRLEEGYGLNTESITQLCDQGAQLIITVDCGITALPQAKICRDRGVDLIITDHHEFFTDRTDGTIVPVLPDCYTVVHPRFPGQPTPYPDPNLCGAAVAFKLAWGIGQAMTGGAKVSDEFREFLMDATALAALGTIADVVPLVGENRVLAAFGLAGLKNSKLVGLQALIESANLTGQKLDSYHVGFLLAPRLNACGRMGHAGLAVEMLTDASPAKAKEIAAYLEQRNRQRQTLERSILQSALEQIEQQKLDAPDRSAIVLAGEGWHPGVIGIVASRIVDRLHRPTVLVALNEGRGQGSGRSISGFHLANALHACKDHLDGFGGHEMAAGLKLSADRFADFQSAFCHYASQTIDPRLLTPELHLEGLAELRQVTAALVADLQRLAPFGHGNRKPLLCCQDLEIAAPPRRVGKNGDHLQLFVRQGTSAMKCIAFSFGQYFDQLQPGVKVDLAVEPTLNEFNGRTSVELEVKDVRFKEPAVC